MKLVRDWSLEDAEAMVRLVDLRFFLPPKLHLWLELCSEGCTPSKSWNHKEEDFGGSVASMSALATSRTTLQSFMAKQPLPTLKGVQVGNPAAGSGGQSPPS